MSNLFKKGFASLALASAMASSVFAGDAAYIDVKVNYLSGTGKATLGYESWNSKADKYKRGARKDLVELYIRVLDKDGNLADKDSVSDVLIPMILTRSGHTKNVDNLRADVSDGSKISEANASTHSIVRSVTINKNVARYTLDYTTHSSATLVDNLIIKAGNLKKKFDIQLDTVDATSLLVRATSKNSIDATFGGMGRYLNDEFKDIKLLGENTIHGNASKTAFGNLGSLGVPAHSIPQITAGDTMPLRIFASTGANNESSIGKFTMAPNLEGKKIVVIAVGDYNIDGNASVYLGQTEITMENGIASGGIVINYGLPERNTTVDSKLVSGHNNFDSSAKFGGLGVAFIAYVKDSYKINNHKPLKISNGAAVLKTFGIDGNNSNTDAIKVKSGTATTFKGGKFTSTPAGGLASKLWTGDKTDVYVLNEQGIVASGKDTNHSITITVVDKLGNPAILPTSIDEAAANTVKPVFRVNGNIQKDNNYTFDFALSFIKTMGMATEKLNHGITSAEVNVSDGDNKIARTSEISVSYIGDSLAGIAPFKFKAHTIDLVGNTPNDIIGDLSKYVTAVEVKNEANSTAYRIYTEETGKDDYDKMKVIVKVIKASDEGNFSTEFLVKVINRKGEVETGLFIGDNNGSDAVLIQSTKNGGGTKVFIEDNTTTIRISDNPEKSTNIIADINLQDIDASASENRYSGLLGSSTVFILKGRGVNVADSNVTHRKFIDAYVATTSTSENAAKFLDFPAAKTGAPGATVVDFDFSGSFIKQFVGKAKAKITFQAADDDNATLNAFLKAGVVGKPFVSTSTVEASANSRTVEAVIPDDGRLSVALYGAKQPGASNVDGNNTVYDIASITVNGFTPVYTSRDGNKLTAATDISIDDNKTVTVKAVDASSAAKVFIGGYNTEDGQGTQEGSDLKNISALPANLIPEASLKTTGPIVTAKLVPVTTNTYYGLFNLASNLEVRDAYGNPSKMKQLDLSKNYVLSVSDNECAVADIAKGDSADGEAKPANIYFKPCAAGKKIVLTIAVSGNEEIKNTITFSNIIKKAENTKFIVSLNVGDTDYNMVNNDVVIKVMPDGGTERPETTITVTSDNKDAKVKVVPVDLLIGREFGDLTGNGNTLSATINKRGSYFVITSDKPGKITAKADGVIPSTESVSGDDVALTGTVSFTVVNVDTSAPTVTSTSDSGSITVTVKDDGLDSKATTVKINDMSGKEVAVAKHTGNGVYVASNLSQGTYSIDVYAMDLSGNIHKQIIVQNVGAGAVSVEVAATTMLLAQKEYTVMGTFTSHNFGADKAKNWIYTRKTDGKSFQLLGNAPSVKDIFGWKETEAKAGTANMWYMVKTGEGRFDWALANADGVAYKLKGAKSDNTFDFSGRLNLNVSYKDGMLTFTKK